MQLRASSPPRHALAGPARALPHALARAALGDASVLSPRLAQGRLSPRLALREPSGLQASIWRDDVKARQPPQDVVATALTGDSSLRAA